jgi:hypoxanthine phosphoribosyltransferase
MEYQDTLKEILSPEEIQKRVRELGEEISRDYESSPLMLVGILKGAYQFLADLSRNITTPHTVDFMRLKSYGSGVESSGQVTITKDLELPVLGNNVVIVEDIIDTGYTLDYLKKMLSLQNAASVKICCLVDKKERRQVDVNADYVGFDIPRGFLVGYGLDYDEKYRYLPGIYHLLPGHEPANFRPSDR